MAQTKYQTSPPLTKEMPPGIPYIVGNEAAERFSYYGMKAILFAFMTEQLRNSSGELAVMSKEQANVWIHTFGFGVYFIPLFGAILADGFLGKYRTIIALSVVYCLGHLALAIDDTRIGLAIGLALIALGSGGIKPCVSAHVGDQFGRMNQYLLPVVFGWFYFAINVGSSTSIWIIPEIFHTDSKHFDGPRVAFAIPGILMFLATIVFWSGRKKFVHVPPAGMSAVREAFSGQGLKALLNLSMVFACVAMFWALFEQTATSWVAQGKEMRPWVFFETEPNQVAEGIWAYVPSQVHAEQMQAINPVLVMIFIPLFNYVIYPAMGKVITVTPLRKVGIGLFITAISFSATAILQEAIDRAQTSGQPLPHLTWQFIPYVILTFSEIMVSITCLEFAYTQAPTKMKSFVMSFYMVSIAGGNLFAALVNQFIQNPDGTSKLEGAPYFWFFAATMFGAAILFVFVAMIYRGQTYIQPSEGE